MGGEDPKSHNKSPPDKALGSFSQESRSLVVRVCALSFCLWLLAPAAWWWLATDRFGNFGIVQYNFSRGIPITGFPHQRNWFSSPSPFWTPAIRNLTGISVFKVFSPISKVLEEDWNAIGEKGRGNQTKMWECDNDSKEADFNVKNLNIKKINRLKNIIVKAIVCLSFQSCACLQTSQHFCTYFSFFLLCSLPLAHLLFKPSRFLVSQLCRSCIFILFY